MAELATSHGYNLQLQVGVQSAFGTPVAATDNLPVRSCNLVDPRPTEMVPGATGSRGMPYVKRRSGLRGTGGPFSCPVKATQIDTFAKMTFPFNNAGAYAFVNGSSVVQDQRLFTFEQNLYGVDKSRYADCRINQITWRSGQGDLDLMVEADVLGTTAIHNHTMTGSLAQPATAVLRHSDLVLTIDPAGTPITLNPESFSLTVNHNLDGNVFRNSLTRLAIPAGHRMVTMSATIDFNSVAKTELDKWLADTGPFAVRAKWTLGGSNSIQFDAGYCYYSGEWPDGDAEVISKTFTLNWQCFCSAFGADDELTATVADT